MKFTITVLSCLVATGLAAPARPTGDRPSRPTGDRTRPTHPTRPGGSSSCDGQCTEECVNGEACVFHFDPKSPTHECACGTPHTHYTHPTGPRPTGPHTHPTHGPHRTIPSGGQNCDAWDEKGTDVSNVDTCTAICKDHRRTFTKFIDATSTDDAKCCCNSGRGGGSPTCCSVPDIPEPSRQPGKNACSMSDAASCLVPTGKIIRSCFSLFNEDCDIDDPDSCGALWECAQKAAGNDATYEKCCGCFEQNLAFMNPDIDLPCEVGRK